MKGDLESKDIDLVIVMRNVWVSDTNLGACGKLCISLEFVAKYTPMNISVLHVQNLLMVTCFCSCSQSNFELC
jgi:hypothetical protein